MKKESQTEIVKNALELEKYILKSSNNLSHLQSEKYFSAPVSPKLKIADKTEIPIKPKTKFNWKVALIPMIIPPFGIWWIFIYYFAFYKRKKAEEINRTLQSAEYKNQVIEANRQYEITQQEYEKVYNEELEHFKAVILPKYNKELEEWSTAQTAKIKQAEIDLNESKNKLKVLYEETKIVPKQYRNIQALRNIYETISTSDYDIPYAIDIYDRNMQRKIDEERLWQQQQANSLAQEQNDILLEQAYLIQEQNEITDKARREAKTASAIASVQRHNANKAINKILKK